jgi:hypothetical protein
MESVKTTFQPKLHGLPFVNYFEFPDFFQLKLPLIPSSLTSLDNLVYGLCGGMCFAALDYFYAQISPPQYAKTQDIPWPYFLFFWQRQINSLNKPVVPKLIEWMLSDDITLAKKMNRWEITKIQNRLKTGEPAALLLVRVKGITDPTKNHQVLAIGYEYEPLTKDLKIFLYDPNYPGEQPELTMNLTNPSQGIALQHSKGDGLRGFFFVDYQKQKPPLIT